MHWELVFVWAVIFIVTLLIEISTVSLTTIWFCVSSFISLILALFSVSPVIQFIIFIVLSVGLLIVTRPLIKKFMAKEITHTNADKLINMVGTVTKEILIGEIGEIRVNSELWRAVSLDQVDINVGEKVVVKSLTGNKVLVSKINNEERIIL